MENSGHSLQKTNNSGSGKLPSVFRELARPYLRGHETLRGMMFDVILALLPVAAWSVFSYGLRALFIIAVSVLSSVVFELLFCVLTRKKISVSDLSAAVSGLVFGLTLPVTVPLWIPVAGSFISVIIFKQLFGGIGSNYMNPAMCARALLFPAVFLMSVITPAGYRFSAVVSEIPEGAVAEALEFQEISSGYRAIDYIVGNTRGNIGELSVILILGAAVFMCVRKTISWHVPVSFAGTGLALIFIFAMFGLDVRESLTVLLGPVMFAAVFAATDPVTSPVTTAGRLIYGASCGIIAALLYLLFRINGVYFAVPVMNLLSRPIDNLVLKLRA